MTDITAMLASREPFEVYEWARELFKGKEYIEAGQALEYLLEHYGAEPGIGDPAAVGRGRRAGAFAVGGRQQIALPGIGEARELLARSYYHSAQVNRAAEVAREILAREPGNAYAVLLLVRSLQRAGRADEAAAAERLAEAFGVDLSPAAR